MVFCFKSRRSLSYTMFTIDSNGICNLWEVIFFAYALDSRLKVARFASMLAILLGLALTAVLSQALQFHAATWIVGFVIVLLFLISASTTSRFNLWTCFFLFSYVILLLTVRFMIIHPIPRKISARGKRLISFFSFINGILSYLTLVSLRSNYCTCKNITTERLEGRDPGQPCDSHNCQLGIAGWSIILAGALWLALSITVMKFGVQSQVLKNDSHRESTDAHYPVDSVRTRIIHSGTRVRRGIRNIIWPASASSSKGQEFAVDQMEEDPRTVYQRICCDYRVKPRNRKQKIGYCLFRSLMASIFTMYGFILFLFIGTYVENKNAQRAPSTINSFVTNTVCAFDPHDPFTPFQSFGTKQEAVLAGYEVAHCGECAYCSNPHDIIRYIETRKTVAESAKKCSMKAIFGSDGDLSNCLEDQIGFTRDCTDCWAENMRTTFQKCILTCIHTVFTGYMVSNNVQGAGNWLNNCILCDERQSGPAFVECSGVARRRLGIISEIERNPAEQCRNVDIQWETVDIDAVFSRNETRRTSFR